MDILSLLTLYRNASICDVTRRTHILRFIAFIILLIVSFSGQALTYFSDGEFKDSELFQSLKVLELKHPKPLSNAAIAVGDASLARALSASTSYDLIIGVLVTRDGYINIPAENKRAKNVIPLYIDPPLILQMYLAELIYSKNVSVLVPRRKESLRFNGSMDQLKKYFLIDDPGRWLRYIPDGVNVVIAHSDSSLFNSANFTSIAKSLYRRHIGLIGFAPHMTELGAVASVYADRKNTLDVVDLLLSSQGKVGELLLPEISIYRVSVNKNLAETFGLGNLDEKSLELKVNKFMRGTKE